MTKSTADLDKGATSNMEVHSIVYLESSRL